MSRCHACESRLGRTGKIVVLALAGSFLGSLRSASADVTGPEETDGRVTMAIASMISRQHLTKHPFDNEINRRWLTQYLKMLDPRKMYFTQQDVDGFWENIDQLDDMARAGDTKIAYHIYRKLLERIDERVKLIDEILAQPQDFTVDEYMPVDPDQIPYAKTDAEMRDRWRKRIKYDLLDLATEAIGADPKSDKKNLEGKPAQEKISKRYHQLSRRMKRRNNDEVLEMYLTALSSSFDPHTSYMSPRTLENFDIQMRLNLEGIGAQLLDDDGETVVKKLIPGGAAAKDGRLKPDDRIIGVGQNADGPIVSTVDMNLNDVVQLIRGHEGTTVRLNVLSKGDTVPKVLNIVRSRVELSDSEARSEILEAGLKPDGTPYKVGVINLPSFYMDMTAARAGRDDFKSTSRDVTRLLRDFKRNKVDAVVVDLRHNGGGSLTESIKLTGLFIDTGPVVQVKDSDGQKTQYDDTDRGVEWDGPLVVLTSKMSASASEIFAGAIQDYKRGLIVGDSATHGKGTVQSLLDLAQRLMGPRTKQQLGALKITEQQFYRPDGDSTQNRGVLPDVELPWLTDQLEGESHLDYAMKFERIDAVPHVRLNLVDNTMLAHLRGASDQRRKDSKEFQKLARDLQQLNAQRQRKQVPLNREKFIAEKTEMTLERQEEKLFEEENDPNRPVVKRDYYFNEVLAITTDYVKLLKTPQAGSVGQR